MVTTSVVFYDREMVIQVQQSVTIVGSIVDDLVLLGESNTCGAMAYEE